VSVPDYFVPWISCSHSGYRCEKNI